MEAPSSFETWRAKDKEWVESNKELISRVFQWFLRTNDWPDIEVFQRALDQDGVDAVARDFAASKPGLPNLASGMPSNITLQTRHLTEIKGAGTLLKLIAKTAAAGYDAYMSLPPEDQQLTISRSQVAQGATRGEQSTLDIVPKFLQTDWPTPFSGGPFSDDWTMPAVMSLIRKFKGVSTPADYIECQMSVIKSWSDDFDQKTGNMSKTGPFTAFVVMPIGGEWSDHVHAFIKRVVASFDDGLEAIRADEIPETGRINDQVIARLQNCDFIIADITHGNLNVCWELGYAYAFQKPCVLTRSTDAMGDAPFDIYDQRRVDYSPDPKADDEQRLKSMIENAIEKVRTIRQDQANDGIRYRYA